MGRITELIDKKCPNGVPYRRFDEVCTLNARIGWQRLTKAEYKQSGEYMLITGTDFTLEHTINFDTCVYVSEDRYLQDKKIQLKDGDILITKDGTIGKVAQVAGLTMPATLNGGVFVVRPKNDDIDNRFLLHFLLSGHFQRVVDQQKTGSTISHLTQGLFSRLEIPIPPLDVQKEIVKVLDVFEESTIALNKELLNECSARRKQYRYYLNSFFDNQDGNLKPLSKVGTMTRGKRFVHKDAVDEGVPCIHYGEIYTHYGVYADSVKSHIREELGPKMRYAHSGDVIIVGAGENNIDIGIGVAWEGKEDVAVHDACYTYSHGENPRYISYYLRSDMYHKQIKRFVSEGKICSISAENLGKALIPIPTMKYQTRVVELLSKIEKQSNEIEIELMKETEAREKQYRYYRDRILDFRKA